MMTAIKQQYTISPVTEEQVEAALQLNIRIKPQDTYLFDEWTLPQVENIFNNITVYNELIYNIQLDLFLKEKVLPSVFVPIATFNNDLSRSTGTEYVAMVEGTHFPFFGCAFSVQKI